MKKKIYLISLITIGLIIINSCQKHETQLTFSSFALKANEKVSVWLNSQKKTYTKSEQWIDSIAVALDFKHQQEVIFDSNVTLLIIPLNLNIKKQLGNSILLNTNNTKLLVIRDIEGNISTADIIAIASNKVYTENYTACLIKSMLNHENSYKTEFNGTISVLKLNRSLIYQSIYVQGKYTQRKILQKGEYLKRIGIIGKKNVNNISQSYRVPPTGNTCTDYYWVTYNVTTGAIISVTYEYTRCDNSGGGGGAVPINEWGPYEGNNLPGPQLCPSSNNFSFATVGNSYTGQIQRLGISLIGPDGRFMNIEFGLTCLSIPFYNITSSQASSLFIQAYNAAVDDVIGGLNDGTIPGSSTSVKTTFKARIVSRLQVLKPGSSMSTGTGCAGSVPTSIAHFC